MRSYHSPSIIHLLIVQFLYIFIMVSELLTDTAMGNIFINRLLMGNSFAFSFTDSIHFQNYLGNFSSTSFNEVFPCICNMIKFFLWFFLVSLKFLMYLVESSYIKVQSLYYTSVRFWTNVFCHLSTIIVSFRTV